MSVSLTCVDQTLQQGLAMSLSRQKVSALAELLYEMNLTQMDVVWQDVKAYELPQMLLSRLRVAMPADIAILSEAVQMGFTKVNIIYKHCPEMGLSESLRRFLQVVKHVGVQCSLTLTYAQGFSISDIENLWKELKGVELDSFVFRDADSVLEPQQTFSLFQKLKEISPYTLEFHAHDGLGLAVANTLSALEAGIEKTAVSVCGVGTLPHAPFEQVIMGAKHLLILSDFIPEPHLAEHCQDVMACLGQNVSVGQPIVGDNIFTHESGLHVFGIMKDANMYEAFSPDEVGLNRQLILGRHSGSSFLTVLLHRLGVVLSDEEVRQLLKKIHLLVLSQKKPVSYQQFYELCQKEVW